MPRRSTGGRARVSPRPHVNHPPQTASHAPPPAPAQGNGGSMLGGLGSAVAQGMALGTGSAIAHRAVDAVMGPRTIVTEATAPGTVAPASASAGADACSLHSKAFQDCLKSSGSDIGKCQFFMDMLNECRRNPSGGVLSA